MREIKFRAWDSRLKVMITNFKDAEDCYLDEQGQLVRYNTYILMQYTGLKDKNGKEIYEGDIVFSGEEKKCQMCGIYKCRNRYPVVWNEEYHSWYLGEQGEGGAPYCNKPLEIIGNIYENPDLLTTDKQQENE